MYAAVLREGWQDDVHTSINQHTLLCIWDSLWLSPAVHEAWTDGFENTACVSPSEFQQRVASLAFSLAEAEGFALGRGGDDQNTPSCGAAMSQDAASMQSLATVSASSDSSAVTVLRLVPGNCAFIASTMTIWPPAAGRRCSQTLMS